MPTYRRRRGPTEAIVPAGGTIAINGTQHRMDVVEHVLSESVNLIDDTGGSDTRPKFNGPGAAFVRGRLRLRGWLVADKTFNQAAIGDGTEHALTLQIAPGLTLAGYFTVSTIRLRTKKRGRYPFSMAGPFVGMTEAQT